MTSGEEPQRIADACHLVAAVRDQIPKEKLEEALEYMSRKYHRRFLKLDTPNLDISSAHLREMIRNKESVKYFLPDSVIEYIQEQHIYGS